MLSHQVCGHGPPLAFLHGFPLDRRMWNDVAPKLQQQGRIISLDFRGFGQSRSTDAFTIDSMAEDVHRTLAALGALPVTLAGLSMGGYVAFAFARKYPDDLRALLLIDTRAQADGAEEKERRNEMIQLVRAHGAAAIAERLLPRLIDPRNSHVLPLLRTMIEECPALTIEHALAAMRDRPDSTPLLPGITIPTLVVVGENDVMTPVTTARAMHQQLPQARLSVIAQAGHMSPMERPQEVTSAISEFLSSLA